MAGISYTKATFGAAKTFNVPSGYRGSLYIYDSVTNNNGEYFIFSTSSGAVVIRAVLAASGITLDTSAANKITLTPTTGTRFAVFVNINHEVTT